MSESEKKIKGGDGIVVAVEEKSNWKEDSQNIALLMFLYVLQGIPVGISWAVPILLQNRGVSYKEQAVFSFAFYPFSMKILWAPLVDSLFIKKFGRRKTWLIPSQILIGAFMIYLAQNVDEWMGDGETKKPQMILLTTVFFILWFLTATQDIAVDGWALTMLQKKNIGHSATCAATGASAGFYLGYAGFLILESKEIANKYIFDEPRDEGLVTLSSFLKFWGFVFLSITILIAIFKRESSEADEELKKNSDYGIKKAYPMLWEIIKLKPIIQFSLVLMTVHLSFAAVDAVTTLKLVEYGIPKDKIAVLALPLAPIEIMLPLIISRFTTGSRPMDFYINIIPYRLVVSLVYPVFVYFTPGMVEGGAEAVPFSYYAAIAASDVLYEMTAQGMFVAYSAFIARVSDPLLGATYMTLLNTMSNIGSRWTKTFILWLVDIITWKSCIPNDTEAFNSTLTTDSPFSFSNNKCENSDATTSCTENGGQCRTDIDGYYIEVTLNVIFGTFWFFWGRKTLDYLQNLPKTDYHILSKQSIDDDVETPETVEEQPLSQN